MLMNAVDEILDKLWIAGITLENAEAIYAGLTEDKAHVVEGFLQKAGLLSLAPNDDTSEGVSREQALFLAAFAKHRSDSIASSPGQLREQSMERIALAIGVPKEAVRAAVQLGPAGIERHVAEVQE